MKDGNVYWSKNALDLDHTTAAVLAVGDSWFWYPFPGGSLISHVGKLLVPKQLNVLVAGNNGAEAYDYVKGKYKRQVNEMLRLYGSAAIALFVSGGGNDFAGFSDLRPMLNPDCSGATTAADCFRPGLEEGTIDWLMQKTFENYALLISRALFVLPPQAKVFVHSYDYAVPDGRGVLGGKPWLKPALKDARVPDELHAECVRFLIDRFSVELQRLEQGAAGRVVLIDSRGLLQPSDWANELHPRPRGFKKIAKRAWKPALKAAGLVD